MYAIRSYYVSLMRLVEFGGGRITGGRLEFSSAEGPVDVARADPATMQRLRGNEIGMIFQEPMTALNPLMTIGDQVAETLMVHQLMPRADALAIARERLDRVGLTEPRFPLDLYSYNFV